MAPIIVLAREYDYVTIQIRMYIYNQLHYVEAACTMCLLFSWNMHRRSTRDVMQTETHYEVHLIYVQTQTHCDIYLGSHS